MDDTEPMVTVKGRVVGGVGNFRPLMTRFPEVFKTATRLELHPGTLNVEIDTPLPIREDFRILGADLQHHEDLLFERCRINGINGCRVRPYDPRNGRGGHGDDILEIVASFVPNAEVGAVVELRFFRDEDE